ncbi:MAG: translation initiation factor IF-2 [Nanoarchaeota archaeon]|nr:translation initiation factor IF-2 [Nanoarchaeota archaeon]MBU1052081.1 translation initiation factor IF-2 [Nanoarchaeota archaeon]
MEKEAKIRQPIVTVAGHVDHGKTSILDCFRGSSVQETEAGGITQKISFTKYPLEQIKKVCPFLEKQNIKLEIPGFLFIDTPGHAAFTNLRKRGGSLADLAIVVIAIKEGIKPQTQEVLQILKTHKTPFLIALNKLDTISGWQTDKNKTLKESIESQASHVSQEFQEALLTFQGALSEHGFNSDLFYDVKDFTKKIAIIPCSAKTKQGIPELLLSLCGLSQKFLQERLKLSDEAKGVILEIKKEKSMECIEAILHDGQLEEGDEIAIASFSNLIVSKIRAIEEIQPLSFKYYPIEKTTAATGIRLNLTNKEGILPGMPFQKIQNNLHKIEEEFKKELSQTIKLSKKGIIIKADSLGSLEALLTLLKQENVQVVKAGIGNIKKSDIVSARANEEINPLDAVVLGFNVNIEEDIETEKIKVLTNDVVYKLIEDLQEWRTKKQTEIEKNRLMELAQICKLEVLHQYVFRNLNPAIFGVKVLAGKLTTGLPLIDEQGESIARVKSMQLERESVKEASEGQEIAVALPGVNFERKIKKIRFLYSDINEKAFKKFKQNKDLLTANELRVLQEIAEIKKFQST